MLCHPVLIPYGVDWEWRLGGRGDLPNPNVMDLLQKLKLTEEGAVLEFNDDQELEALAPAEWALVGKVLSPVPVHVSTVRSAMKPAWGNPVGLKLRAIAERVDNLFVVEFGSARYGAGAGRFTMDGGEILNSVARIR